MQTKRERLILQAGFAATGSSYDAAVGAISSVTRGDAELSAYWVDIVENKRPATINKLIGDVMKYTATLERLAK